MISLLGFAGCSKGFRSATSAKDQLTSSSRSNAGLSSLRITTPSEDGNYFRTTAQFAGSCEPDQNVEIRLSGSIVDTFNCDGGTFNTSVNLSAADGTHTVQISQMINDFRILDFREIIKDTVAPAISVLSPAPGSLTNSGLTVSGTCDEGFNVAIQGDLRNTVSASCINGAFSADIEFSNGDGDKSINFAQTDFAGNSGNANLSISYDTTPPALSIATPNGTEGTLGLTVTGGCETGSPVQLSGAGIQAPISVDCTGSAFSADILFSSGDGNKEVIVTQSDLASNTATLTATFVRGSASAPMIAITAPAAGSVTRSTINLQGNCEDGFPISISGDVSGAPIAANCVSGNFNQNITLNGADGSKNVTVSQTNGDGLTGSDSRSFIKDTSAPVVAITAPASGLETVANLSITGTCESSLPVAIDSAGSSSSTNCTNGMFSAGITLPAPDGSKTITVSQTDSVGNSSSDSISVVRDTVAPNISIAAPAAGTEEVLGLTVTGSCESSIPVRVSGSGVDGTLNVNCNSSAFSVDVVFSSGVGNKVVTVSQTDMAGNMNSSSRTFVRIAPPPAPAVTITAPASNIETQGNITLSGTCEGSYTVVISGSGVSSALNTSCNSGNFSQALTLAGADGVKNIVVSQTDSLGMTGSATRNFIKDTTAPVLSISNPTAGVTVGSAVTVAGSCETGIDLTLWGPGVETDASASCVSGQFSQMVSITSGGGSKEIRASQTDQAGNFSTRSVIVTRDATAPVVAITAPAAGTQTVDNINLIGTCESGITVDIQGDLSRSYSSSCSGGAFSTTVSLASGPGMKTVAVSQTDSFGNQGSNSRTFELIPLPTAPVVAITSPSAGTSTNGDLTISGTCTAGINVTLSGSISGGSISTPCNTGTFSSAVVLSGTDGNKNITATQTDQYMQSGADARSFVKDNLAPVVAITSPSAGAVSRDTVLVSGTCESGINVDVYGDVSSPRNVACSMSSYSATVTLSSGDGSKNIYVAQTDAANNQTIVQVSVARDTVAPVVAITSPAANSQSQGSISITGSCENGIGVQISGSGVASTMTTQCNSGAFSLTIMLSDGTGTKVVGVSQTDIAGNTGSDSRNFERIAPPVDGVMLYAQHCATCHGQLAVSNRKNRTAAEIQAAISNVPSMNRLSFLTTTEVDAIADALVDDGSGGGGPGTVVALEYRPTVGHRRYVASHMENIFYDYASPSSQDNDIQNEIQRNILANPGNMGGPCTMHDPVHTSDGASTPRIYYDTDTCDAGFGDLKTTAKALPAPVVNALRKGHTTNVCEAILENDKAVSTALSRVGLTTSSSASANNLNLVFQLFFPGQTPDTNIEAAMANLYNAGSSRSGTDRWRFTLLAHCMSSAGDLL